MAELGTIVGLIKSLGGQPDPEDVAAAVAAYLEAHPEATAPIDDTAGAGDTGKIWSADKSAGEIATLTEAIAPLQGGIVSPEQYGAVGDGETDDSQAIQDACDAGYEVRFADNKTYYLASTVTIDHDVHLIGGKNTVIKTATPSGGTAPNGIVITGTLKKTTTLTGNYKSSASGANNAGDRFELTDMTDISIGDIMVITATDQYYSYCRDYYYLGGNLLVCDVTNDYIWTDESLPFDITNSENVSVKIYDAPTVTVENLKFVSDLDSAGNYCYSLRLCFCKNSTVKNTEVIESDNGVRLENCVNSFVEDLFVSKMPAPGSGTGSGLDHYGLCIQSCTNTTVERMMGNAANACIDMTGTIPNLNTYIKHCNLVAMNKFEGLDMHENAYNTVVEDCVIAGFSAFGTVSVNRCRFVRSFRKPTQSLGISFRGGHVKKYGRLTVTNCVFDSDVTPINIPTPYTQDNPPQAFHHIIDEILIENCTGGTLMYAPSTSQYVLSNKINRLTLRNWHGCKEIYHLASGAVEEMIVENCQFAHKLWINDHDNHLATDGIHCLRWKNDCDQTDKMYVDIKELGGRYYVQGGIPVSCSSSTQTDRYQVCGKNIASNKPADYGIGVVIGWEGDTLSFDPDGRFASALSVDASGNLVFTQPNNLDNSSIYPLCLVYVPKYKRIKFFCTLKNTGATTGAYFRPYLAVVDVATGKVNYRNDPGKVQATADGANANHDRLVETDSLVCFFLYCCDPVEGSETTIENYACYVISDDFNETEFIPYTGSSRTGNGNLETVDGMNNFLVKASGAFDMKFRADLVDT